MKVLHYFLVFIGCSFIPLSTSDINPNSYVYENLNNYKISRRSNTANGKHYIVLNLDENSHPKPLPTIKKKLEPTTPYQSIQQGSRIKGRDKAVYNEKFTYPPQILGHQIIFREILDCIINYIYIETVGGIPIILRGGVGHRYFMAVAKAKPMDELTGKVKAYCYKSEEEMKKKNQDNQE